LTGSIRKRLLDAAIIFAHDIHAGEGLKGEQDFLATVDALDRDAALDASPLKAALERIADPPSDGCGCEHDTKDCCAFVSDYHCPECIAWQTLMREGSVPLDASSTK
jgi:hypothetical protein